ncbi:hypothetical protein PanWU01x14_139430 [Parasponia andersonii]|uniref:Uncharacterized protein n=1 Tax=Parasponia andersonii TaxID=3476 RepID=A0A2P5CMI0_PARAD|nr:hypothetical protein PanWU01x14_139430 [Parasponia andersonii]
MGIADLPKICGFSDFNPSSSFGYTPTSSSANEDNCWISHENIFPPTSQPEKENNLSSSCYPSELSSHNTWLIYANTYEVSDEIITRLPNLVERADSKVVGWTVKEKPEDTGRYSFVSRKGQQLVNDFPSCDKNWTLMLSGLYGFGSNGHPSNSTRVRKTWGSPDPTSNDPPAVGLDSLERINKLKSAPIKSSMANLIGHYVPIIVNTLKVERDSAIERVSDLEKHMVSKDESLLNAKKNAQAQYDLFVEFQDGKSSRWKVEKEIKEYEEEFQSETEEFNRVMKQLEFQK